MTRPLLLLVDGHNLLWRSAFGFPARVRTRDGRDVTAPFGFFALLRKAIRELGRPVECIVCFDGALGWTGRLTAHPGYKASRRGGDVSPVAWIGTIRHGLAMHGIGSEETTTFEADDLIATLTARTRRRAVAVMSSDRDFHQLLLPRVHQLNPLRPADRRLYGPDSVVERYGVWPEQWCDYVALVGDRTDDIAGVAGIGPKRAASLLADGARIDQLQRLGRLSGPWGGRVGASMEAVLASRELARLRRDADTELIPTGRQSRELPLAARVLEALEVW